jgi:UrcA family protein
LPVSRRNSCEKGKNRQLSAAPRPYNGGMKTLILLASALAAMPAGAAATVDPAMDYPTIAVPFNDLDLATAEGQARLEKRISVAVRQVCYEAGPPSTQRQRRMADCAAFASRRARHDAQLAIAEAASRSQQRLAALEQSWR